MSQVKIKQIPAICCLAALAILCGRVAILSSADEELRGESKRSLSLSDLISSFLLSSNGDKTLARSHDHETISLSTNQLSDFFDKIKPNLKSIEQEDSYTSNRTNHRRKSSRRKLLYDSSIRSHYDMLIRGEDRIFRKNSSFCENETCLCAYYNQGLDSIMDVRDSINNKRSVFSQLSYWTFKICRQRSVEQLHLVPATIASGIGYDLSLFNEENDNDTGDNMPETLRISPSSIFSNNIQFMQTAVLDLGTYLSPTNETFLATVRSEWGDTEIAPNVELNILKTDYYTDGSLCISQPLSPDSKNRFLEKRRSKVVFEKQCCERLENANNEIFYQDNKFFILSISEQKPCQYIFSACISCLESKSSPIDTSDIELNAKEATPTVVDASEFNHMINTYVNHLPEADSEDIDRPGAFPPMPRSQIEANKLLIKDMFTHAYDSYMYNAFPASELRPITCSPGTFDLVRIPALTLIDSLDTLIIMKNFTEFARSIERLRYLDETMKKEYQKKYGNNKGGGLFNVNQNVSLFETTIRVLGGLLSAHQMAVAFMYNVVLKSNVWDGSGKILFGDTEDARSENNMVEQVLGRIQLDDDDYLNLLSPFCCPQRATETSNNTRQNKDVTIDHMTTKSKVKLDFWVYDGFLLTLAHDIGKRLIHAFDTDTGIPYGTVNLLCGVPTDETTVASLAGAGTLTLEFELLSRLTGDESFGKAAKLASSALWARRSFLNLLGKHIDIKTGKWTEVLSGIGSNSDSFYEYLAKYYMLFPDDTNFWTMFISVYSGVWENSRLGDWYVDVDMGQGLNGHVREVFESLMAFYPGLQILLGEFAPAAKTLNSFFLVREFLGMLPERFNFNRWKTEGSGNIYPLRPELLESCYYLHLATIGLYGSSGGPSFKEASPYLTSNWLWAADFALNAILRLSWTSCGFATILQVGPATTGSLDFVKNVITNPLEAQQRLNIKHENEMPSFFLSETIKYLYLTFDAEDNILHQDFKRDWIFTTEAHPIHYVPITGTNIKYEDPMKATDNTTEENLLQLTMSKIRKLLKEVSSHSNERISESDMPINYSASDETIIDDIQKVHDYFYPIKLIEFETNGLKVGLPHHTDTLMYERTKQHAHGVFSSELSALNYAHFTFKEDGRGMNLGRRCPNIHHPSLSWALALNGHTLDYNIMHRPVSSYNVEGYDQVDPRMHTALASSCFYGTHYYSDGLFVEDFRSCSPLNEEPLLDPTSERTRSNTQEILSAGIPGATRYNMGSHLGLFDVSAFAIGDGFVVRHVNSNELLEVSFFQDEIIVDDSEKESGTVVLVVLTTPSIMYPKVPTFSWDEMNHKVTRSLSSWQLSHSLKNILLDNTISDSSKDVSHRFLENQPQKHVVLADMNGNSFSCEVILEKSERGEKLARIPCSPGFFGKAHMQSLIESDGLSVHGHINIPQDGNELGCDPPHIEHVSNGNNFCLHDEISEHNIQMVVRGKCSFVEKAMNQHLQRNLEALIVVNDKPEELFVMARDKLNNWSPRLCSQKDLPVSVLISGNDGHMMIELINAEVMNGGQIEATVKLSRENHNSIDSFPFVKGSKDALHILASNGWGTHAVQHAISSSKKSSSGWQLFITAHDK